MGHRGALVRSFSPDECRNVFLVRAELEGLAAERAAGRLTTYDNADLASAQALLRAGHARHQQLPPSAEAERLIALEQCSQANELFQNVILAAANCPPLRETVQSLANRVPRTLAWHNVRRRPGDRAEKRRRPRPDPRGDEPARSRARPRKLLQDHVLDTGETLARWLERQGARS